MFYEFNPELKTFYSLKELVVDIDYDIKDLDLEKPDYQWLKRGIA